jgi:hypothetical protein
VGSGSGSGDDTEAEPEPLPGFSEARNVFESVKVFFYAHNITKRDQVNIMNTESLLSWKMKSVTKQMKG